MEVKEEKPKEQKTFEFINFESSKIDFSFPGIKYVHHTAKPKDMETCTIPFSREWSFQSLNLPPNWKEVVIKKIGEVSKKFRSFKVFMDTCVYCGSCGDKCIFFLATGDPKNMPFRRSEMLRSVYRRYYTRLGKIFGSLVGARELTEEVLKEWYIYYYHCSECRRCSVFCPFGIDNAEVTMFAREILSSIGITTNYTTEVIAKATTIGNNLGIPPLAFKDTCNFAQDEVKEQTGEDVKIPVDKKGAEVLFVTPSADYFGEHHWNTFIGYVKLFHSIGLDYTLSSYASEGGNFGLFVNYDLMKKTVMRIVSEAKRLGVKWILGGECGHMWRVFHDYIDTLAGPLDFLEPPVSPITGTKFTRHSPVHICEFTADLIKHNKLKLDPTKNDGYKVTFHDSCNPARAMGLLEEPRYILKRVCNNYVEMDPNFNRLKTYCCGAGAGLLTDEIMELRMRAGGPKMMAIKATNANFVAMICAICKANFGHLIPYWGLSAKHGGVHELVGNALVFDGKKST